MSRPKGIAGIEDVEAVERIEPSELVYFKKVMAGLDRARELEQQAVECQRNALSLRGAHGSWVSHLVERYNMDPDHDEINSEDGTIQRAGVSGNGTSGLLPPP